MLASRVDQVLPTHKQYREQKVLPLISDHCTFTLMDIVPTIMILYLWCTCRGQSQSPIFTVSIFSIELRPCLLSIFFGKYTVCSLSSMLKVTFPLLQSIIAPTVLRKGLPRIMDMLPSSGMSSTTKSVRIKQLATFTGTSSQIPIGTAVDLSAI